MKRNVTMTHLLADHINTGTLMKMEGFLVEQLVTSLLQLISTIQLRNQKYRPWISLIRAVGPQWCWWQSYIGGFMILVTESICWWLFHCVRDCLRVVQTQAITFLKSISERVGSEIERLWIWMTSSSIDFESIQNFLTRNSSFYFRL